MVLPNGASQDYNYSFNVTEKSQPSLVSTQQCILTTNCDPVAQKVMQYSYPILDRPRNKCCRLDIALVRSSSRLSS
jgi:hypothetical protein